MNNTRYTYRTVEIPEEEAQKHKADTIAYIQGQLKELRKELREAKETPLVLTRTEQTELHPGEEGYNEAPCRFVEADYQGDYSFIVTGGDWN